MEEPVIAGHALKHDIQSEDIEYAWNNYVAKQYRGSPREGEVVAVGYDWQGRLIELVAAQREFGLVIYHAIEPPTTGVLRELGFGKRR